MPIRQRIGFLYTLELPFLLQLIQTALHRDRHPHAGQRVFLGAPGFRIPEEDHDRVADELVDGRSVLGGDLGHFPQVAV